MRERLHKARIAPGLREAANQWLVDNGRLGACLNVYDNGRDGLLFVFNDRDTAVMMKLAVG